MKDTKKISAVMSAVMNYIQTEEEAIYAAQAQADSMPAGAPCEVQQIITKEIVAPKVWSISGRQTLMQMRNLMQLKSFR